MSLCKLDYKQAVSSNKGFDDFRSQLVDGFSEIGFVILKIIQLLQTCNKHFMMHVQMCLG